MLKEVTADLPASCSLHQSSVFTCITGEAGNFQQLEEPLLSPVLRVYMSSRVLGLQAALAGSGD